MMLRQKKKRKDDVINFFCRTCYTNKEKLQKMKMLFKVCYNVIFFKKIFALTKIGM